MGRIRDGLYSICVIICGMQSCNELEMDYNRYNR